MGWLHDRQPVILPDHAALATWLDTGSGTWSPALSALCAPVALPLAWSAACLFRPSINSLIGAG